MFVLFVVYGEGCVIKAGTEGYVIFWLYICSGYIGALGIVRKGKHCTRLVCGSEI